jgi:vacuolar-type H+-ATPase subunit F/Vma7
MSSEADSGRPVAVVGRAEVVAPFRAAGLAVFPVEPAQASAEVARLVSAGYGIIFYTEDLEETLSGAIRQCSRETMPCLVLLPMGGAKQGMARLREIVKRAVGADVFATAR